MPKGVYIRTKESSRKGTSQPVSEEHKKRLIEMGKVNALSRKGKKFLRSEGLCGHLLTPDNLIKEGERLRCLTCKREDSRAYQQRTQQENPEKFRKKSAKWRRDNLERCRMSVRNSELKKKYGITLDQANQVRLAQGNKCGNRGCNVEFDATHPWQVDHDHATGEFRGLLCRSCNTSLGHLRENEAVILGLLGYLRLYKKENECLAEVITRFLE